MIFIHFSGYKPSLIGVHLRDTHGVGKSHYLTGSKILRVLKSLGAAPELPEDLYFMIKKAVGMRKHLERNRKVTLPIYSSNCRNFVKIFSSFQQVSCEM